MIAVSPLLSRYYPRVPKDRQTNLRYRSLLMARAPGSESLQKMLKDQCRDDILFWVNSFVWTYDIMRSDPPWVPFVTFPAQDEAILTIQSSLGRNDVVVHKSRDMGASYICLLPLLHAFIFKAGLSFLIGSRNADYVEKRGNPKTLFWKLDSMIRYLPAWMKPKDIFSKECRTNMHIANSETGSVIDGESFTGDFGRGDRRTAIMLDEFAATEIADGFRALDSTQMTSRCRIFNSTPQGTGDAYHDQYTKTKCIVRLHWSKWPIKARGLYSSEEGKLKILDPKFWETATVGQINEMSPEIQLGQGAANDSPAHLWYPFIKDGKLRSPYYDQECLRTKRTSLIAKELDMDFLGSGEPLLAEQEIIRLIEEYARDPFYTGEVVEEDGDFVRFNADQHGAGHVRLWVHPEVVIGEPKQANYVIGVDVAGGSETSDSVLCVLDTYTGEQVASYVNNLIEPGDLAQLTNAVSYWFAGVNGSPAMIIWEHQGPGAVFGNRIAKVHKHPNLYRREMDETSGRRKKAKGKRGIVAGKVIKYVALKNLRDALLKGVITCRSESCLQSAGRFQMNKAGYYEHAGSGEYAEKEHGDEFSALTWAAHAIGCDAKSKERPRPKTLPMHCTAWFGKEAGLKVPGCEG